MKSIRELEERWPMIEWREPAPVRWSNEKYPRLLTPHRGDVHTYACRVCIHNIGLKRSSQHQWPTEAEAREHIREHEETRQ